MFLVSISGLVVEYIVAIDVTRVRFPADALFFDTDAISPTFGEKLKKCPMRGSNPRLSAHKTNALTTELMGLDA